MGKAEEAACKRKNKAARKRLRRFGDAGSSHSAIIAAKRRRKAGKRRICEGMCYSLPTPEDPFNDRSGGRRRKKKSLDNSDDGKLTTVQNNGEGDIDTPEELEASEDSQASDSDAREDNASGGESASDGSEASEDDRSLLRRVANSTNGARIAYQLISQGIDEEKTRRSDQFERSLWGACQKGVDVIGTIDESRHPGVACLSAATSHISSQPSETRLSGNPMALFLVASQKDALFVRNLCKPLKKALGIQAVSIHPGTTIERQIEGLNSTAAHILVATPDRLCELLKRKDSMLHLLDVSFLVIVNLQALIQKGSKDTLHTIKLHTSPSMQSVILSENFCDTAIQITREYIEDPVTRITGYDSLKDLGACIAQEVSIIIDDSKKLAKVLSLIGKLRADNEQPRILVVANKDEDVSLLTDSIKPTYKTQSLASKDDPSSIKSSWEDFSDGSLDVIVAAEAVLQHIDLSAVQVVINYDFPPSIEKYCNLLASMARNSVHGILHSLCGCSGARFSRQLVNILKECSQPVPTALQMLADASAVLEQRRIVQS